MLALPRKDALKLTGRLFTLRRDVNLVSNVLDVPELFWDEASLKALYDAVREYMEIGPRVQVMNEKIAVAEDLVGADICATALRRGLRGIFIVERDTRSSEHERDGSHNMDHHLVCLNIPARCIIPLTIP